MQDTPKDLDKKRADEKLLVSEMIALYGLQAAARLCPDAH